MYLKLWVLHFDIKILLSVAYIVSLLSSFFIAKTLFSFLCSCHLPLHFPVVENRLPYQNKLHLSPRSHDVSQMPVCQQASINTHALTHVQSHMYLRAAHAHWLVQQSSASLTFYSIVQLTFIKNQTRLDHIFRKIASMTFWSGFAETSTHQRRRFYRT